MYLLMRNETLFFVMIKCKLLSLNFILVCTINGRLNILKFSVKIIGYYKTKKGGAQLDH